MLCKAELTPMKAESVNVAADSDDVSLRLKTFVEKLDAEKTDLENRLHEEQRWVWHVGSGIRGLFL